MTDLTDLLDSAAGQPAAPTPDVVDADLRRGRRALLHRRWAVARRSPWRVPRRSPHSRSCPGTSAAGRTPRSSRRRPVSSRTTRRTPASTGRLRRRSDPQALSPGEIPQGWAVAGDEYALVVSPPGLDTSPADFVGKLVVYLDSAETGSADGRQHPGRGPHRLREPGGPVGPAGLGAPGRRDHAARAGTAGPRLGRRDPRPVPRRRDRRRGRHGRRRLTCPRLPSAR